MEYYCIMVKTGEETAFKEKAQDAFLGYYPDTEFFFFQRRLRTNKGKYFDAPLFPGYLFFRIEKLSDDFILLLKSLKSFYRILIDNTQPVQIQGKALDELKLFIRNGEHWGVSKVQFLPGKKVRAISGPLVGLEGNIYMVNKKKKHITVISSLSPDGKRFDLLYEDAELLEEDSGKNV